jgi:hypothetical protein
MPKPADFFVLASKSAPNSLEATPHQCIYRATSTLSASVSLALINNRPAA